jgi:hypothetical protein
MNKRDSDRFAGIADLAESPWRTDGPIAIDNLTEWLSLDIQMSVFLFLLTARLPATGLTRRYRDGGDHEIPPTLAVS